METEFDWLRILTSWLREPPVRPSTDVRELSFHPEVPRDAGFFSQALRNAGIVDNEVIDLPGSVVVLPFGVRLLRRYISLITELYEAAAFLEFDYPSLAPLSCFEPTQALFQIRNRLLYAGTIQDFTLGRPRGALNPTGEALIYTHWKKLLRAPSDLPMRMFRRADYYRPFGSGGHAGRSVFSSMEASDVVEFHCAYASPADSEAGLQSSFDALQSFASMLDLPVIWTTRPPWTNNGAAFDSAIAGDVLLPTGNTVQVAAIYDQGQRFSRAYGISIKDRGRAFHPRQISGYLSRRMLFASLYLTLDRMGRFSLHPTLAPDQTVLLGAGLNEQTRRSILAMADRLRAEGVRVACDFLDDVRLLKRRFGWHMTVGTPLVIAVHEKRCPTDLYKLVLYRSDLKVETVRSEGSLTILFEVIRTTLADIHEVWHAKACHWRSTHVSEVESIDQMGATLAAGKIAVGPLVPSPDATRILKDTGPGEVLGFAMSSNAGTCMATGQRCLHCGFISRRL